MYVYMYTVLAVADNRLLNEARKCYVVVALEVLIQTVDVCRVNEGKCGVDARKRGRRYL